jgi:DNA-binding XRE family transcriptional regulator
MRFPAEIKQWRQSKALTQKDAAQSLGIPLGTLRNLEQGRYQPSVLAVMGMRTFMNETPLFTKGERHRRLKDPEDIRNRFTIRARPDELTSWKIAAAAAGKTLSAWLREAAKKALKR